MELYDVVKKLIGEVEPVGETNEDNKRFENLKVLTGLVEKLIADIDNVYFQNCNSQEHSVKRAADFADNFMEKSLGIPK